MLEERKKDVRALLADAIKKRDELNTFIKVLQEMLGAEAPRAGTVAELLEPIPTAEMADPLAAVYPGMFFGKSQPQAAKLLLERVRRPLKTAIIIEGLEKGGCKVGGKKPAVNLWGILNRNKDTFIMVRKAGWGLIDWYEPSVIARMRKEGSKENNGESGKNS